MSSQSSHSPSGQAPVIGSLIRDKCDANAAHSAVQTNNKMTAGRDDAYIQQLLALTASTHSQAAGDKEDRQCEERWRGRR